MKTLMYAALAALMLCAAGCAKPAATTAAVSDNFLTHDKAGFAISVPAEINRIVSMVPSITATLIDLGLGEKIVAMDTHSAALVGPDPGLPTFDFISPDAESIAALEPDLVLASGISMMGSEENDPFAPLKRLGICVAYLPTSESIEGIIEDLRFVAAITKRAEAGERLIAEMERAMDEIAKMAAGQTVQTVYFEISAAPDMYSFGSGVYQNEMLALVGAKNIFSDFSGWLPVEAESVVAANPDVIFTSVDYIDDPVSEIKSRPGWEEVGAVKNGRVYYLDNAMTSQPNHNITKGMAAMAAYLYNLP